MRIVRGWRESCETLEQLVEQRAAHRSRGAAVHCCGDNPVVPLEDEVVHLRGGDLTKGRKLRRRLLLGKDVEGPFVHGASASMRMENRSTKKALDQDRTD